MRPRKEDEPPGRAAIDHSKLRAARSSWRADGRLWDPVRGIMEEGKLLRTGRLGTVRLAVPGFMGLELLTFVKSSLLSLQGAVYF